MNLSQRRRPGITLLVSLVVASAAQSPRGPLPLPLAPGANVVTIAPAGGNYTEPSIAINPKDPRQVIAVYQGGQFAQGSASAAYSTDGGRTFAVASGTKPADWKVAGDVTTTFDNKGRAFLCYLAFD